MRDAGGAPPPRRDVTARENGCLGDVNAGPRSVERTAARSLRSESGCARPVGARGAGDLEQLGDPGARGPSPARKARLQGSAPFLAPTLTLSRTYASVHPSVPQALCTLAKWPRERPGRYGDGSRPVQARFHPPGVPLSRGPWQECGRNGPSFRVQDPWTRSRLQPSVAG